MVTPPFHFTVAVIWDVSGQSETVQMCVLRVAHKLEGPVSVTALAEEGLQIPLKCGESSEGLLKQVDACGEESHPDLELSLPFRVPVGRGTDPPGETAHSSGRQHRACAVCRPLRWIGGSDQCNQRSGSRSHHALHRGSSPCGEWGFCYDRSLLSEGTSPSSGNTVS